LGATLEGKPVEMWTAFEAAPGQVLRFGPTRSGARCYLCVRGGVEVQLFLDSASTHILSGLGGHKGRALKKGDVLTIGLANRNEQKRTGKNAYSTVGAGTVGKRRLSARALKELQPRKVLRVTPGPQSDWFSEAAKKIFQESTYRVAAESNRMGIRLQGGVRPAPAGREMISEGGSLGAGPVPEGGESILLVVGRQATGGSAR